MSKDLIIKTPSMEVVVEQTEKSAIDNSRLALLSRYVELGIMKAKE